MEVRGGGRNNAAERVAVGPGNVLKVELEAGVTLLSGGRDQLLGHPAPCRWCRNQPVKRLLFESGTGDNRHHGNMVFFCIGQHGRVRPAGNKAVGIDFVPRGNENIDFVRMRVERANAIWTASEVKQRFLLAGLEG